LGTLLVVFIEILEVVKAKVSTLALLFI